MPKTKKNDKLQPIHKSNKNLSDNFKKLIKQMESFIFNNPTDKKTPYRIRHIKNGLKIILKHPSKITSSKDIEAYKGVGKGIMKRVDEILKTGNLDELDDSKQEIIDKMDVIDELQLIHGIGPSKARELVKIYKIRSIKDLKKKYKNDDVPLNKKIALGLKYHDIVKTNIPRSEIDKYFVMFKKLVKTMDKNLELEICGSYRRKKLTSNDIDVLFTHKKIKNDYEYAQKQINYIMEFIELLKNKKILVAHLTDKTVHTKYMGYCKLKNKPVRRIDIRFVPYQSYSSALLYFTGSGTFNKMMRSKALKNGYTLNEYGLYKFNKNTGKKGDRIPTTSEKEIFDILEMKYLEPSERNL